MFKLNQTPFVSRDYSRYNEVKCKLHPKTKSKYSLLLTSSRAINKGNLITDPETLALYKRDDYLTDFPHLMYFLLPDQALKKTQCQKGHTKV